MKAAAVTAFDVPPHLEDIDTPTASGPRDLVVDVVAAGLHPRVRSQADGSHSTRTDEHRRAPTSYPLVPRIDGVGRGPDERLRLFVLPEDGDAVARAAAMNPATSSWVALCRQDDFQPGQRVLVLGATDPYPISSVHLFESWAILTGCRSRCRGRCSTSTTI